MRLTRQNVDDVTSQLNTKWEFGKGVVLKEGSDLAVFATGGVVANSLAAAEAIEKKYGLSVSVVNIHTIRPLDKDLVKSVAQKCGKVVTVEDHQITGGLGEEIASHLSEVAPTPVHRIGLRDVFGESGTPSDLYEKFKLNPEGITEQISNWLQTQLKLNLDSRPRPKALASPPLVRLLQTHPSIIHI